MSVVGISSYIAVPLVLWSVFAYSWVSHSPGFNIIDAAMIIGGFAMISTPFWIAYIIYLSVTLIPKLDQQVYSSSSYTRQYSDSWLARCISLNSYAGNLMHERVRKRDQLPVDMREQPPKVRFALRVHVIWMISAGLALAISFLLETIYR